MKEIIFLLLLCICISSLPNQTPVIGIFTQSSSSDEPKGFNLRSVEEVASNYSYIATSYVKYIQMSGAQVIPIFGFSNKSYFDEILPKINGVLFPGGDQDININNIWTQNANYILKYA
jgi:gamma-glutamyl hydrolase